MKILVTGGAGFIGSHISIYLSEKGFDVEIIDNLERSSPENLRRIEESNLRLHVLDLRKDNLRTLLERYDVIIHAAAYVSVEESMYNPWIYIENNFFVTERLTRYLSNKQKIIYLSSAAVYGEPINIPIKETDPTKPRSPYGLSKLLGEKSVIRNSICNKYRYIIFRVFNVYGKGQNRTYAGVITVFLDRLRKNLPPIIYGDGGNTRDFIHVRDVAKAVYLALDKNFSGIYNLGSGRGVAIKDLAEIMIKLSGKRDLAPVYSEARPGDIRLSVADITRIKEDLGFIPSIDLVKGLSELFREDQNSRP
ncbi:MAG: NAD-dependent epimerase/dehydratase family protein [Sulfolobales archaeon]